MASVPLSNIPRHVAIVMDGNGRWARKRFMPRFMGHKQGVEALVRTVRACADRGIEYLTVFAFSSENWKRPEDEVNDLMGLLRGFIKSDIDEFAANDVRLKIIGEWRKLAPDVVAMIDNALERTAANTGPALPEADKQGIFERFRRGSLVGETQSGHGLGLNIARELARHNLPLVGINQGRLGFITDIAIGQYKEALAPMVAGDYEEEHRTMIEGGVWADPDELAAGAGVHPPACPLPAG